MCFHEIYGILYLFNLYLHMFFLFCICHYTLTVCTLYHFKPLKKHPFLFIHNQFFSILFLFIAQFNNTALDRINTKASDACYVCLCMCKEIWIQANASTQL